MAVAGSHSRLAHNRVFFSKIVWKMLLHRLSYSRRNICMYFAKIGTIQMDVFNLANEKQLKPIAMCHITMTPNSAFDSHQQRPVSMCRYFAFYFAFCLFLFSFCVTTFSGKHIHWNIWHPVRCAVLCGCGLFCEFIRILIKSFGDWRFSKAAISKKHRERRFIFLYVWFSLALSLFFSPFLILEVWLHYNVSVKIFIVFAIKLQC